MTDQDHHPSGNGAVTDRSVAVAERGWAGQHPCPDARAGTVIVDRTPIKWLVYTVDGLPCAAAYYNGRLLRRDLAGWVITDTNGQRIPVDDLTSDRLAPPYGWPLLATQANPLHDHPTDPPATDTLLVDTEHTTNGDATNGFAPVHRVTKPAQSPGPGSRRGERLSGDPLPDEPRTDLGYAHRLVEAYGSHVRYVATWGQWLIWDGRRWAPDTTGQTKRWMKAIARTVTTDALTLPSEERRKQALKEAKRGESSSVINGALSLASTETGVVVDHEDLDADPYLLNCTNGTINLRTGTLQPHDPTDLLTKLAGAAYHPTSDPLAGTRFGQFLTEIQPDNEIRDYLARLLGHALVGRLVEHILPIFWGDGANGKSTLLDVVLAALGDYAGMAAPGLLTARSFDAHPTEIADLFGLRLARLDETDEGRRLAEGTVKRLTGDRRQKARRMRENFWEFDVSHTFVMLTNHKPLVAGTDIGIWRRLRLVPFATVIPEQDRDETLPDQLARETNTVLAWLTQGCRTWQHSGLDDPQAITDATNNYRAESDAIGRFLEERCNLHTAFKTQSAHLFAAWTRWCTGEGLEPGTNKAFTAALQNRGHDTTKTRGRMTWTGIGLATTDSDDNPR